MKFICPRCGYETNQKGDIRKHFKRKTVCSPTSSDMTLEKCYEEVLGEKHPNFEKSIPKVSQNESKSNTKVSQKVSQSITEVSQSKIFECEDCGETFSKKNNYYRHRKHYCKMKDTFTKNEVLELLKNKDKLISELSKQIEVLLTKVGNNNTTNSNNTQNNYIIINAFGKENMDYITDNYVKKLLDKDNGYNFIPKLLKQIHFNDEHKENMNVCIPNKKNSLAKIYNGDKWILEGKRDTIEKMTDKAYKTIINKYDENENKSWKKIVDDDKYYDDDNVQNKIQKSTELMILNNQEEVVKNANSKS